MKFRELKSDIELEIYRHAIHKHIDVLFPLEYLKQGRVYGFYNKEGDIYGGFALITEGPFRVLDSIPNFKGLEVDADLSQTAELTGLWLSNTNRKKHISLKFWLTLLHKILISEKKYFVYAYSSCKVHLEQIYSRANPIILFKGETIMLPGMTAVDHESVELLVRNRLIIQALKNPDFFLKRLYSHLNMPQFLNKKFFNKDTYEIYSIPLFAFIPSPPRFGRREHKDDR